MFVDIQAVHRERPYPMSMRNNEITVEELIEKLKKMPRYLKVMIPHAYGKRDFTEARWLSYPHPIIAKMDTWDCDGGHLGGYDQETLREAYSEKPDNALNLASSEDIVYLTPLASRT